MMDPGSAIGVASAVIAFIDFSWKLVTGAKELYDLKQTTTKENIRISKIIKDLNEFSIDMGSSTLGTSKHEKAIQRLACDCGELCGELIVILKKLKAQKNSRWESLKITWAALRKKEEITDIERRLGEYRAEINTRLLALIDEKQSVTRKQLDAIQLEAQSMSSSSAVELAALRADFTALLQKLENELDGESDSSSILSTEVEDQEATNNMLFQSLEEISTSLSRLRALAENTSVENRILRHLYFEGIFDRIDMIVDASEGTFEWLILPAADLENHLIPTNKLPKDSAVLSTPPDYGKKLPRDLGYEFSKRQKRSMEHARQLFARWLSEDGGVLHISGKAGSGKSTLLKLITNHEQTTEELHKWAGTKTLATASFYFWKSDGKRLQMTLDGMYRSILFFILRNCPQLMPDVFPQQWEEMKAHAHEQVREADLFRIPRIKDAFESLMSLPLHSDKFSFCIFIDGLDEYDADSSDQRSIARKLRDWGKSNSVKICVSSRPEVHFLDTFPAQSRINLHEITEYDIYQSVRDSFEKDEIFYRVSDFYVEFVENIVKSAEGVFLWARLVVKLLLEEAGMHATYERLARKLRSTPSQLDDLYDMMLSSLHRDDVKKIHFLLLLVATNPFKAPIAAPAFDSIDDQGNILTEATLVPYSSATLHQDQERIERQVQGLTRGLLVLAIPDEHYIFSTIGVKTIGVFHRTVKDYLLTPSRRHQFESLFPGFDPQEAHATMRAVEIRRVNIWDVRPRSLHSHFIEIFESRQQLSYTVLSCLETVWKKKFKSFRGDQLVSPGQDLEVNLVIGAPEQLDSYLALAAHYGQVHFIRQRLSRRSLSKGMEDMIISSTATKSFVRQHPNILLSAVSGLVQSPNPNTDSFEIIEFLLSIGYHWEENVPLFEFSTQAYIGTVPILTLLIYGLADWTLRLVQPVSKQANTKHREAILRYDDLLRRLGLLTERGFPLLLLLGTTKTQRKDALHVTHVSSLAHLFAGLQSEMVPAFSQTPDILSDGTLSRQALASCLGEYESQFVDSDLLILSREMLETAAHTSRILGMSFHDKIYFIDPNHTMRVW